MKINKENKSTGFIILYWRNLPIALEESSQVILVDSLFLSLFLQKKSENTGLSFH